MFCCNWSPGRTGGGRRHRCHAGPVSSERKEGKANPQHGLPCWAGRPATRLVLACVSEGAAWVGLSYWAKNREREGFYLFILFLFYSKAISNPF